METEMQIEGETFNAIHFTDNHFWQDARRMAGSTFMDMGIDLDLLYIG
jgi:hypothetical protein